LRIEGLRFGVPFRDFGRWSLRFGSPLADIDVFSERGGVDTGNNEERDE
jgi:hypothetical protein